MKPSNFNSGVSPLAMEATQRYLKANEKANRYTSLKMVCIVLFVFTVFNSLFVVMMLLKNALIIQENTQLIQENQKLIDNLHKQSNIMASLQFIFMSQMKTGDIFGETEKFAKLIDGRAECPPCTTEAPIIVEPHRNPVSVLNEQEMLNTNYECLQACENPPIHIANLTIKNNPAAVGKSWEGRGPNKSASKQVAAYRALRQIHPDLLDLVAEEHIPDESYTPLCNHPTSKEEKAKC